MAAAIALLGSFTITAVAQAGSYDDYDYDSDRCAYRCGDGYQAYRYPPYRYRHVSRPSLLYERRFYEREYVERRYGWPTRHYRRHYGYHPYGGYRSWRRFPWGYGGVRNWRTPYGSRYEPSANRYAEQPQRPAPVWDEGSRQGVRYEDDSARWNAGRSWPQDPPSPAPVASYGAATALQTLPRGPLALIASGLLGFLNPGAW